MRRLTLLACLTVSLAVVRTPTLYAQASTSFASTHPPLSSTLHTGASASARSSSGHSLLRRIGTGVAAAVLGAGVGYFFSEVALGDWAQNSGHGSIRRSVWAGVGGAAAFTLGFSFPIGSRRHGGEPGELPRIMFPTGRSVLTAKEIQGAHVSTAYDAVRSLRPEWLQRRQSHYAQTDAEATIPVYLGDQLLGGLDELSTISAQNVKEIFRYDVTQATLLLGPGNPEGAIQVITNG